MSGLGNRKMAIGIVVCLIFSVMLACSITSQDEIAVREAHARRTADAENTQKAFAIPAEMQMAADADMQATQVALSVQGTTVALQAESLTQVAVQQAQQPVQQPVSEPPTEEAPPPAAQAAPANPGDSQPAAGGALEPFDTWKTKASTLVYEDMAGLYSANRTVKDAFEALGLKITKDDKDSSGFFLSDIRSGGPGGKPWDLIVSASEARTAVQGEFIPPLNEAVGKGSALIMEQWNIDAINLGKISTLMTRCGVSLQHDLSVSPGDCTGPGDESFLVLWAIDGTSPILHEPNDGLRLSSMAEFWTDWYSSQCALGLWSYPWDYGDRLQLIPGSKAIPVLGTKSTDTDRNLELVSCQDGRLILWTSSTHNYANDRVLPLWMNMIHNALKARYNYLSSQGEGG